MRRQAVRAAQHSEPNTTLTTGIDLFLYAPSGCRSPFKGHASQPALDQHFHSKDMQVSVISVIDLHFSSQEPRGEGTCWRHVLQRCKSERRTSLIFNTNSWVSIARPTVSAIHRNSSTPCAQHCVMTIPYLGYQ